MAVSTSSVRVAFSSLACDSLVALPHATASGDTLFAKNSDRPASEAQPLARLAAGRHPAASTLRCQYIEIPQVPETAIVMGSRPWWLWGFEHGLNEHGVAIGNHTVFTRDPLGEPGLIGMDLVRLGLERARSAKEAMDVIASLAETYGQGGSGHVDKDWAYSSSFLIADRQEAYLLETSDRRWAARKIEDTGAASNHLTIGSDWFALSPDAERHAREQGWWSESTEARFDFAAAYRDTSIPESVSSGRYRRCREALTAAAGRLAVPDLFLALRDHYGSVAFRPGAEFGDERYFCVCRHDAFDETAAGAVMQIRRDPLVPSTFWACLGSPCVGIFLPFYLECELPRAVTLGGPEPDGSLWWRFKRLLRAVERGWEPLTLRVRSRWDPLEREFLERDAEITARAAELRAQGHREKVSQLLQGFVERNVERVDSVLDSLLAELAD